jgi:hypothetical protein
VRMDWERAAESIGAERFTLNAGGPQRLIGGAS